MVESQKCFASTKPGDMSPMCGLTTVHKREGGKSMLGLWRQAQLQRSRVITDSLYERLEVL